jgi:hypothetical protein
MMTFCHGGVDTKEATFLTAIVRAFIKGYRQTLLNPAQGS